MIGVDVEFSKYLANDENVAGVDLDVVTKALPRSKLVYDLRYREAGSLTLYKVSALGHLQTSGLAYICALN